MARIISFSHTTPALVNGHKTMTTRAWKPEYAAKFKAGAEILAYDKNPRNGGKPVARLRLTQDVQLEDPSGFTRADFQAEGFGFLAATNDLGRVIAQVTDDPYGPKESVEWMWRIFKEMPPRFVVRFELLELLPGAEEYLRPSVVPLELPEGVE